MRPVSSDAAGLVVSVNGNVPLTLAPTNNALARREGMLRDSDSWDAAFDRDTHDVCRYLLKTVNGEHDDVYAPLHGGGTFAVEAAPVRLVQCQGCMLVRTTARIVPRRYRYCSVWVSLI